MKNKLIQEINRYAKIDGKSVNFLDIVDQLPKETLVKILTILYEKLNHDKSL